MADTYKINEIFCSMQGEGTRVGQWVVFVRFSGCNLNCCFCDTEHEDYREMTGQEIMEEVYSFGDNLPVVFTGGEPLLQLDFHLLDRFQHRVR